MPDRRALGGDIALAVAVTVAVLGATANIAPVGDERDIDTLAFAAMAVAGLVVVFRRPFPRAVLAVITSVLVLYTLRRYAGGPIYLTMAVPLYTLAVQARQRRDAFVPAGLAVMAMVLASVVGLRTVELSWHTAVFPGWAAAALFLGEAVRSRREYLAGLEERARHLEETREEEARRRVVEERMRIARDLHDVVAHTIATVNLQAGVAAHVLDRRPEHAREALEAIRRASGTALHELKATLDVLRADTTESPDTSDRPDRTDRIDGAAGEGTGRGDGAAPRAPTPGLDRVDDLVANAASAGLPVTVERIGPLRPLPAAVDVAGYRIVQESITNVMRHAEATRAAVVIRSSDEAVDVEVVDDGRGAAAADGEGHGIVGMRERVALVGGTLDAGPRPGGGYRVHAHLPVGTGDGA